MDGRAVCELRWDLDQRLRDENSDRVEVGRVCGETEPLGLERDASAATERIENGRRVAVGRAADLNSGLFEDHLVRSVLPLHESPDDLEQAGAFILLGLSSWEAVGLRGRVVDDAREQHGAAGCERSPRPPVMHVGRPTGANRLFARRRNVDRLEGQGNLDELALVPSGHAETSTSSPCASRSLIE